MLERAGSTGSRSSRTSTTSRPPATRPDDPVPDALRRNGLAPTDIAGKVRSITFRAVKA